MNQRLLPDADATLALGAALAAGLAAVDGCVVYLSGELGAGKTTLTRGLLAALGHQGRVKSPTYTLIESYPIGARTLHHLDLYRLAKPEEASGLGVRDLAGPGDVLVIEWPERGVGALPHADLEVRLAHAAEGRLFSAVPLTDAGRKVVAAGGF